MRYWVGFDVGKAFHWLYVLVSGRYQRRPSPVLAARAVLAACLPALAADLLIPMARQSHSNH